MLLLLATLLPFNPPWAEAPLLVVELLVGLPQQVELEPLLEA